MTHEDFLCKQNNERHTGMAVAAEKGLDTVLAFWSAEEADYLEYFVTEAQKRNIYTPYDLTEIEHDEYEEKWNGFCDAYFAQGDEGYYVRRKIKTLS